MYSTKDNEKNLSHCYTSCSAGNPLCCITNTRSSWLSIRIFSALLHKRKRFWGGRGMQEETQGKWWHAEQREGRFLAREQWWHE